MRWNRCFPVSAALALSLGIAVPARAELSRDRAIAVAASWHGAAAEGREVAAEDGAEAYGKLFPHRRLWAVTFRKPPEAPVTFVIDRDTGDVLHRAGCC